MIDRKAFRSLSSGLYLVTAKAGERRARVVNTLVQVASEPRPTLSVSLNKENATTAAILESGRFAATVLAEDAPMELIGTFGFHTSADTDKFAACTSALDGAEVPYVTEHGLARFSVSVTETIDAGSHYLFVGVVEEAEVLASGDPLTYAYYHAVKGGKTPPKAATYNGGDEAAVPGVTETAAGAPDARPRRSPGAAPSAATSRKAIPTACPRAICAPSAALPARCSSAWSCSSGSRTEKAPRRFAPGGGLSFVGDCAAPTACRCARPQGPPRRAHGCAPLPGGASRRRRTRRRTARRRRASRSRKDP